MQAGARNRNREIAELLTGIGDLLEVKGEIPFKVAAYRKGAAAIEALREPIELAHAEGRLRKIAGIGPALALKISEYLETGRLGYYDKLAAEFPPGLVEVLQVPGLGPRKARLLYDWLGIDSLAALEDAATAGKLRDVP